MASIYDNVTVEMFKDYYARDFSNVFLPWWNESKLYNKGDKVYYVLTDRFYISLVDNNSFPPADPTYWEVTQDDKYNYITNQDITRAMGQARATINPRFGADDNEKIMIYMHLIAFYLVMDLKNAGAGVASSFNGVVSSKSVGDVSESYAIPEYIMKNPVYSIYAQNGYGLKYLSLILPYMATTILFSRGGTTCG